MVGVNNSKAQFAAADPMRVATCSLECGRCDIQLRS